ncbi:hypothetical protein [Wenyingzhuangia sp. IMCC45574]
MNKLLVLILSFTIFSCANDDGIYYQENKGLIKKIKFRENSYNYSQYFTYGEERKLIEYRGEIFTSGLMGKYEYDNLGRPITKYSKTNYSEFKISYKYDDNNRLISVCSYDTKNESDCGNTYSEYKYLPGNKVELYVYNRGVLWDKEIYTLNNKGKIEQEVVTLSSTIERNTKISYTYDEKGNLTERVIIVPRISAHLQDDVTTVSYTFHHDIKNHMYYAFEGLSKYLYLIFFRAHSYRVLNPDLFTDNRVYIKNKNGFPASGKSRPDYKDDLGKEFFYY